MQLIATTFADTLLFVLLFIAITDRNNVANHFMGEKLPIVALFLGNQLLQGRKYFVESYGQ